MSQGNSNVEKIKKRTERDEYNKRDTKRDKHKKRKPCND